MCHRIVYLITRFLGNLLSLKGEHSLSLIHLEIPSLGVGGSCLTLGPRSGAFACPNQDLTHPVFVYLCVADSNWEYRLDMILVLWIITYIIRLYRQHTATIFIMFLTNWGGMLVKNV